MAALRRVDTAELVPGLGFDEFIVYKKARWLSIFSTVGCGKLTDEMGHGVVIGAGWIKWRCLREAKESLEVH